MTAEPSASIWEVTRLILDSPDRSPSEIAHEHGYTAAEIAELMPIFLDTARTDWSVAADTATDWATPAVPDAELYLRDLAGSGSIEVAGFDAAPDADVPDPTVPDTDDSGDVAAGAEQGWTSADEPLPPDLGELLDGPGPGVPLGATADGPSGVTGPEPDGVGGEAPVVDGAPPELDGTAEGPDRRCPAGRRRGDRTADARRRVRARRGRPVRDRSVRRRAARRPDRAGPARRALGRRVRRRRGRRVQRLTPPAVRTVVDSTAVDTTAVDAIAVRSPVHVASGGKPLVGAQGR